MIVDADSKTIVIRVVYDGLAGVGKTTNLQKLKEFFKEKEPSLLSPGEANGRTLFFDMLQIRGGSLAGYSLLYQFLTVPGQLVLTRRRSFLLSLADVVVFVCESTEEALQRVRYGFSLLRAYLEKRAANQAAIILQANKQDMPSSLEPSVILRELSLSEDTPIVKAIAQDGTGVRETAALAARLAGARIKRLIEASAQSSIGFEEAFAGKVLSGEELYQQMLHQEMKVPFSSVNSLLVGKLLRESTEFMVKSAKTPTYESASHSYMTPVDELDSEEKIQEPKAALHPGFPQGNIPSGFIWPAEQGRELLTRFASEGYWSDVAPSGPPAYAKPETSFFLLRGYYLKTSPARCFQDADEARSALLSLARAKARLGRLLLPETTLVLREGSDQQFYLWTIAPKVQTLSLELDEAHQQRDEERLTRALTSFAQGLTEALCLASRKGLSFDLRHLHFAYTPRGVFYLDDALSLDASVSSFAESLLTPIDVYQNVGTSVDAYLLAIEASFLSGLTQDDIQKLSLRAALEEYKTTSPKMSEVRHHLLGVLSRSGR